MYIIPAPQEIKEHDGTYILSCSSRITIDANCPAEAFRYAKMLQKTIDQECGYTLPVDRGTETSGGVYLSVDEDLRCKKNCGRVFCKNTPVRDDKEKETDDPQEKESYALRIDENGIHITGASLAGVFYGIQTLKQILRQTGPVMPKLEIVDYPDLPHRGFYHDVTRGRIPTLDWLKKLVDRMASYKLNQLHLYMEHSFLFREFSEVWRDDTPLTPEDILELDAYCRERFIDLVPSIASFGHLYKVLRTRSYRHLCELPDQADEPFRFVDRMRHHTLDVSNPESLRFAKRMMDEVMPLFTSDFFNIGADETFDLGKGNSRKLADEKGTDRLYMDFVKELCEYVVSKGKIPMFWGDIICSFPEAVSELPKQTICLNWGYEADVTDRSTRKLSQAGATLYNCPGVSGWDQLVPRIRKSYENIRSMCSYAYQYGAIGILNTDWGDCGHVNHPDFSVTGMIYGAAFSWNKQIAEFEDINRQISLLEFTDRSQQLVSLLSEISENQIYTWRDLVNFMEGESTAVSDTVQEKQTVKKLKAPVKTEAIEQVLQRLDEIAVQLYGIIPAMDTGRRPVMKPYLTAIEGMKLIQLTGSVVSAREYGAKPGIGIEPFELASQLEWWFYEYKEDWRKVSRESELFRIEDVISFYADYLRK